ncbi:MAG: 2-C-methyl-D-erythritol 4-phosphate cytidylyltransferase [Pedobacter sp.]|nr:MAG: 2-C-methyl-D-erythritol 4-phosphate cytidylyltransferase [Pedobacter sp.]
MPQYAQKYIAIIVGGGSGTRMGSELPKQFMLLNQKPVLMHTIAAFHQSELSPKIIITLPNDFHSYWEELCQTHQFTIPHSIAIGGNQRFDSVKNSLALVQGPAIIAIHDAVRPLVNNQTITNSFLQAEQHGSAIAAIPSTDSVRQISGDTSTALCRENIYLVQTPQTFRSDILEKAYQQAYHPEFTDDAAVVEKSGFPIKLIVGQRNNIKITFPEDLLLAEFFLSQSQSKN